MSVAIPVIDHVDPDLRRIYLKTGVREIHMLDDIYFEMRNLRRTDESLRGWYSFVEAGGNVQKTPSTFTPRYLTFLTDPRPITTKIVPAGDASTPDVDHTLVVKGEGITDLGTAGATCFDKSSLLNSVDIEFEPPGAEIIRLDQELIEHASFNDFIHVDPINGVAGTGYIGNFPIGSPKAPSNNWTDAHTISAARGIKSFLIYNNTTIATENFSTDAHIFKAVSPFITVTVDASANVASCDFTNMTLVGELDGVNVIRECSIGPITSVSGFFEKCAFWSTVDMIGDTQVLECYSQAVGAGCPEFYTDQWDLQVRDWHGSICVDQTAIGHESSIEVYGGRVIIPVTVTEGAIHVRGQAFEIQDSSSGNAVVSDERDNATIEGVANQMNFSKAGELDVNVKSQNGATVYGNGTAGNLWRGTP